MATFAAQPQNSPTPQEVRDQVRATIREAQQAAQEAARDAQAAQGGGGVRVIVPGMPPNPPFPGGQGGITIDRGGDFNPNGGIPSGAVDIAMGFFIMCAVIVIGWPLARAFGRRMERKSDVAAINPAMTEQLQRIEQAVEAISIEVERISESQRFVARLQSSAMPERGGLPGDRG